MWHTEAVPMTGQQLSGTESRRVGCHPAVTWEQQSRMCVSSQPLAVTKTQSEVLLTGTRGTPQEKCSGGELQKSVGLIYTDVKII